MVKILLKRIEMSVINKFTTRFLELEEQLELVGRTRRVTQSEYLGGREIVDGDALSEWKVKAKNLLVNACGSESEHYKEFLKVENPKGYSTSFDVYKHVRAVFRAAKEDFEGGYLASMKALVQAEVFESELEQAEELLTNGYCLASAVIAGVVLETGLRELCARANIDTGKLDKMNSDLAKLGVYSKLQQKRITALADIRNSAAHGKQNEFSNEDVKIMIRDVEGFLAKYLTE